MNFTIRDYLILNTIVAIFLIYYFLFWKRSRKENGFRLKKEVLKKGNQEKNLEKNPSFHPGGEFSLKDEKKKAHFQDHQDLEIKSGPESLNVIFMYNSHEWDAYEVLGLPAGSSIEKVEEHYKKALSKVDQSSKAFFEMAYKAILVHRGPSSNQKN